MMVSCVTLCVKVKIEFCQYLAQIERADAIAPALTHHKNDRD